MENAVHADAPADANVQHAHAIVDALNLVAPSDADLVVTDASVELKL